MERTLGMTVEESEGTSWRGTVEGGMLKSGGTQAWYRYLHTDESRIYRVDGHRPNSTPVRCVKD